MFEIYVYKFDDCWWFDDKIKNIMGEELVMGVPEFIETYINKNEFRLNFSAVEIEDYDFKFDFIRREEEGHIYKTFDHEIWLCSILLKYFDNHPNVLYFKII